MGLPAAAWDFSPSFLLSAVGQGRLRSPPACSEEFSVTGVRNSPSGVKIRTLPWNSLLLFPLKTSLGVANKWFKLGIWLARGSRQGLLWFLINNILTSETLLCCCRGCSAMQIFMGNPHKGTGVASHSLARRGDQLTNTISEMYIFPMISRQTGIF